MDSLNEDLFILNELGLSASQAKIYLSIVKSGVLTVHEASKHSGVARPHVYRILAELSEMGLVIKVLNQPERFQAIPLEECITAFIHRRLEDTANLQQRAKRLLQNFKTNQSLEIPDENQQFMLIPKKDAVYAKAEKMVKNVRESIDFLCLTRRMIAWLSNSSSDLEEALTRKVHCRVIMPKPEPSVDLRQTMKKLLSYKNFSLKIIRNEPKFGFSIWDSKEILMTTSPVDSPTPATSLWSNNVSIVELCKEQFDCMWKKAKEVGANKE